MKLPNPIREDFSREPVDMATLAPKPIDQFESWFIEACAADPDAPNALSLATASADGRPSVRTVLLKLYDEKGFVFFTNYASRKAKDLTENAFAAMLFPWTRQGRPRPPATARKSCPGGRSRVNPRAEDRPGFQGRKTSPRSVSV